MNELALSEPAELMRVASDVAGLCKAVVEQNSKLIGDKKYPKVEAWMTIATAHNCVASAEEPKRLETGYQSRGYLKRISDGAIIAEAWGFVGDDEPLWANRAEYARRAMAQTRAISRVCRSAFAHVVTMMNIKGMSTTPAEEVPGEGFQDHQGGSSAPKPPKGSKVQEIEGKLTGVAFANGWWNAFIKGIKFGTNDKEFEKVLWQCNDTEVIATLETKTTKEGKPWFKLVKLIPSSMNQELDALNRKMRAKKSDMNQEAKDELPHYRIEEKLFAMCFAAAVEQEMLGCEFLIKQIVKRKSQPL